MRLVRRSGEPPRKPANVSPQRAWTKRHGRIAWATTLTIEMKLRKNILLILVAASVLAAAPLRAVSLTTPNTDVNIANTDYTRTPSSGNLTAPPSPTQGGGSYTFSYGGFSGVATVASGSQATPSFSLTITNNTGSILTSVTLSGLVAQLKGNSGSITETLVSSVTGISGFTVASTTAGGVASNSLDINTVAGAGAPSTPVTGAYNATISGFSLANGSSFTITWTDKNDGGTDAMFGLASMKVKANVAGPTNNDSVLTVASSVNLGRAMQNSNASQNVTVNKAGASATGYTASVSGDAKTTTPTGSISGTTGTLNVGVDSTTTGAKVGTITLANTATTSNGAGQGSLDPNDTISVSGTIVADRTVTSNSVNLGKVFVGATVTGTATLTTTGADDKFTRITTSGSAVTTGEVTIAASSNTTFNSASSTATRGVSGNFGTSGAKNVTANIGVTGEGLAGENAQASVGVTTTADVYERAALSTNNSGPLDDGASVTIDNAIADGSQRASAQIASQTVTAGWSVTGLGVGTDIAENSGVVGTVGFNSAGKLNGVHAGSLVIGFQYSDSSIQGAGANPSELAARTWTFSHTVTGNVSDSGSAGVDAGGSFAGFGLISANAAGTQANLLAGTAGSATNVTMDFSTINPGATNDIKRVSDVLALNGTGPDTVVLQLSYNDSDLGSLSEDDLRLGWLSNGQWVLAIDGNVGGTPAFFLGAYAGQGLGSYGLDTTTNTVWAVIDHNSDFAVIAVPEPGTYALLALGGAVLVIFRRRKLASL